jgi:hypothetical protein
MGNAIAQILVRLLGRPLIVEVLVRLLGRSLNWSRGLFRLWVLFAVSWVPLTCIIAVADRWETDSRHKAAITRIREQFPGYFDLSDAQLVETVHTTWYSDMRRADFVWKVGLHDWPRPLTDYLLILGAAAAPPAVLFAIGASLLWALRGFKP